MSSSVPELFAEYFFTNGQAPLPFVTHLDVPLSITRCINCGRTIAEHCLRIETIQRSPFHSSDVESSSSSASCSVAKLRLLSNMDQFEVHIPSDYSNYLHKDIERDFKPLSVTIETTERDAWGTSECNMQPGSSSFMHFSCYSRYGR